MIALEPEFPLGFDPEYIDDVTHIIAQICERSQYRSSGRRTGGQVKDYVNGAVGIYIHIGVRPRGSNGPASKFCLLIERSSEANKVEHQSDVATATDPYREPTQSGSSGRQGTVLVRVVEFAEYPQRMTVRVIDSIVRLYPLDNGMYAAADCTSQTGDVGGASSALRAFGSSIDWESSAAASDLRNATLGKQQLDSQVVERRAEIVNTVSNESSPPVDIGMDYLTSLRDIFTPRLVVLADEAVGVRGQKFRNLVIDSLQVTVRPTQLGINTTEGRYQRHGQLLSEDHGRTKGRTATDHASRSHNPGADS